MPTQNRYLILLKYSIGQIVNHDVIELIIFSLQEWHYGVDVHVLLNLFE